MVDFSEFNPSCDEPSGIDEPEGAVCKFCGSNFVEYQGEQYDDDYHEGSAYKCHDCGMHFVDEIE